MAENNQCSIQSSGSGRSMNKLHSKSRGRHRAILGRRVGGGGRVADMVKLLELCNLPESSRRRYALLCCLMCLKAEPKYETWGN